MNVGEIRDLSNADYHAHAAVGASHLKAIARSPAHYWAEYLDPNRGPREEKPAFVFGSAVHCAVLEPDRFRVDYIFGPKFDRRTKAGKEAAAAFEAEHAGKIVLDVDQYEAALKIRKSVENHDIAAMLFDTPGRSETSLFWRAENVAAKCRPDFIPDGSRIVLDLKTTDDARQAAFARDAYTYRYHLQAAWYLDGVLAARGVAPDLFVFLVVEKSPPYAVAAYYADQGMIDAGRREISRALSTLRACRERNEWPAYPPTMMPLSLPAWAAKAELSQAI